MAQTIQFRDRGRRPSQNWREFAKSSISAVIQGFKTKSKPMKPILADHAFTIGGFGCISAASFVHSVFSGLLVTGILLLILEWKVSDLCRRA